MDHYYMIGDKYDYKSKIVFHHQKGLYGYSFPITRPLSKPAILLEPEIICLTNFLLINYLDFIFLYFLF